MYERLSTREIVACIACLVIAAGLIVLGAVYLVNSNLTADELAAAKPAENAVPPAAERAEDAAPPAAKPAENAVPPAATMQLGTDLHEEDSKIASAADMPARQ